MPIMNGIEATKILVQEMKLGRLPTQPIVAVTAADMSVDEEVNLCKQVGFDMYQRHPMTKSDFINLMHKYGVF